MKVNMKINKIMVFERKQRDTTAFANSFRVTAECEKQCQIKLN